MENNIIIRYPQDSDFEILYALGKNTPELRVSVTEEFMSEDEFKWTMHNEKGVFLLAEQGEKIIGFIYASFKDMERPYAEKWGCLVYITVLPVFRKQGVANMLYQACTEKLKSLGATNIYCWANIESDGSVVGFMKKQGFLEGHKYMWMDRKL